MRRFVEGVDRGQTTLFPECLEDWIGEDNPVRVVDVFVEELDLAELGFGGVDPEATGRPSHHPSILLKLYIYGYLNRVRSSRRRSLPTACRFRVPYGTLLCVSDKPLHGELKLKAEEWERLHSRKLRSFAS